MQRDLTDYEFRAQKTQAEVFYRNILLRKNATLVLRWFLGLRRKISAQIERMVHQAEILLVPQKALEKGMRIKKSKHKYFKMDLNVAAKISSQD